MTNQRRSQPTLTISLDREPRVQSHLLWILLIPLQGSWRLALSRYNYLTHLHPLLLLLILTQARCSSHLNEIIDIKIKISFDINMSKLFIFNRLLRHLRGLLQPLFNQCFLIIVQSVQDLFFFTLEVCYIMKLYFRMLVLVKWLQYFVGSGMEDLIAFAQV